uniref:Uncharacterized protein n=1 Tax=Knipowitschia caucasica TaxID=637954 RepID=A0AAV2L7Y7_KNICA
MTELLTTKLAEHKADLLAEIKETHTRYEAKLDSVLTIVDDHKRRISSLELSANATSADLMGIQATLGALSAENAKLKAKVVDLEGRSRRSNIRIIGTDVLPSPPELDRAHRTLAAKPGPTGRARPVLRGKLKYKDVPFHIVEDYPPEVMEQRTPYRVVMKRLYDMGLRPALWFPAKLSVVLEDGTRKFLSSVKEAMDFADSRGRRELMDD